MRRRCVRRRWRCCVRRRRGMRRSSLRRRCGMRRWCGLRRQTFRRRGLLPLVFAFSEGRSLRDLEWRGLRIRRRSHQRRDGESRRGKQHQAKVRHECPSQQNFRQQTELLADRERRVVDQQIAMGLECGGARRRNLIYFIDALSRNTPHSCCIQTAHQQATLSVRTSVAGGCDGGVCGPGGGISSGTLPGSSCGGAGGAGSCIGGGTSGPGCGLPGGSSRCGSTGRPGLAGGTSGSIPI